MVLPDSDGISRVPPYSGSTQEERTFDYRAFTCSGGPFQVASSNSLFCNSVLSVLQPQEASLLVWALPFRSPLLRESIFLSLPPVLRCFSSLGLPSRRYVFTSRYYAIKRSGFPIRKSPDQSSLTAPRSISVLVPSFFGS